VAVSNFKLAIHIGAALGSSFKTAIKGSQKQLGQLGASIDTLKGKQAAINTFELAEVNVGKARAAYKAAARNVSRLRQEISRTEHPSKQLTRAFDNAKKKAERLSSGLATQRERLQRARRALDQTGLSTKDLARDNRRLGSTVDTLSRKYRTLGQAMNAQQANRSKQSERRGQLFDAVAIGATIAAPLKIAVDFEQSIAKLGAITKSSDEDMKGLATAARGLGETTQFSASEAAAAMTFLGMAGFGTNQILSATPGVLKLAQAAGAELGDTADISSNILSGFSLEAEQMGRVGDVLTETFASSNTTLRMLGDTLKFAAPVASAVGGEIEQVAAMAGLLGNVGIQGSLAGTALRATFLRLSAPPKKAADSLAALGIEVKDLDGNLRSVPEVLKEISQATATLGTAEQAEAIKHIFGQEAAAGGAELLKQANSGALDDYIQRLKDSDGAALKMARRMEKTTQGSLKKLGSALESVAISVGSLLLPAIASGAHMFASFASGISGLAQTFPLFTTVIVGATVGLVAIRIATIAGTFAYGFMKGAVLSLRTAYLALSAGLTLAKLNMVRLNVLSSLTAVRTGIVTAAQWAWNVALTANPIGLIVVGIGALIAAGALLVRHWGVIKDFFGELWASIKGNTGDAVQWLLENIYLLVNPFALLTKVASVVGGAIFGGDDAHETPGTLSTAQHVARSGALGTAIAAPTVLATPLPTTALPPVHTATRTEHHQAVRIDAPITVNASPGMDEQAIARQVQHALDERQARAAAAQRSNLFDGAQ